MAMRIGLDCTAMPGVTPEWVQQAGFAGVELPSDAAGGTVDHADSADGLATVLRVPGWLLPSDGRGPSCLEAALSAMQRSDAAGAWAVSVKAAASRPGRGLSPRGVVRELAGMLRTLADEASRRKVMLLIENGGALTRAAHYWWLLETTASGSGLDEAVRLSWNTARAVLEDASDAGGAVSLPMLNERLAVVRLSDVRRNAGGEWTATLPGDGDAGMKRWIDRLRGLGYEGWLSVASDGIRMDGVEAATGYAAESLRRVREWIAPPKPAAAAKPVKAAAHAGA